MKLGRYNFYDPITKAFTSTIKAPYQAKATLDGDYTDIVTSSTDAIAIRNWGDFGEETLLTASQLRTEIAARAATYTMQDDALADIIVSKWFAVDKTDRDTVHSAIEQQVNGELLAGKLYLEGSKGAVSNIATTIKALDKAAIDTEVTDVVAIAEWDLTQNELLKGFLENLAAAPGSPVKGQIYFNTTDNKPYVYDGTTWVDLSGGGGDTQHHVINFGVDGLYTSAVTNPSWGVLGFRICVGSLSDYFDSGTKLKGKIIGNSDISDSVIGRIQMINETDSGNTVGIHNEDVNTILWQSGNTIRYTFNGTPDLTKIKVEDSLHIDLATNASNNGDFIITAVNDSSDYIEVTNSGRSDATDDEASDSPAVAEGGSVFQFTNGTLQINKSPEFEVPQNSEYRLQLNRSSSGGNPSARIGGVQLLIWPE